MFDLNDLMISTEHDSLLQHDNLIARNNIIKSYISNRLIFVVPIEDTKCTKITRSSVKFIVAVWSTTGTIPYALISIDFAGKNALGYSMFSGNVTAYASLNSWALLKMIDAELSPLTSEEKLMKLEDKKYNSTCVNIALKITAVFLGINSQLALGYLVYVYNSNSLSYAILTITSNSCFPSYSLFLTFDEFRKKITQSSFEKKLQIVKDFIVNRINENFKLFLELSKDEQRTFIQNINNLKDKEDLDSIMQFFKLLFFPLVKRETQPESCLRTAGRWITKGIGGVFTLGRLGLIGITAFKAIEMVTTNSIVCGIGATFITSCNALLSYDVCVNVNAKCYDSLIEIINKRSFSSLAYNSQPKIFMAVKLLTLGITSLSWGSSYEVSHDYTSGGLQEFMDVVFPMSTVILVANAMHDLGDTLIQIYAKKKGDPDTKLLLEFHEKVNKFCLLLKYAPLISFAKFLTVLPNDILNECLIKGQINMIDLQNYLKKDGYTTMLSNLVV